MRPSPSLRRAAGIKSTELELSGRGILCLLRLPPVLGKTESTQLQHCEWQVFYCSVWTLRPTFASQLKNGPAVWTGSREIPICRNVGKVSRYATMVHEAGRSVQLLPVPVSTLGGWHPDAHRALCSVATTIAARGMSTFSSAKSILFQRHAALHVTNNALCLMSGLVSGIWEGTYCST